MNKIVIFDWGGVIAHKYPIINNDKEAIIRVIKSFNNNLSDEEAWDVYIDTLKDEFGVYISKQNDTESKIKWVERIKKRGKFDTTFEEFQSKYIQEYLKVGYYKEVVEYIYSLKGKCKIGIFSDLIYISYPTLNKQVDLSQFDYVWLSYQTHLRKDTEEAFNLVQRDTNALPEDILFIDDTAKNIEIAKNIGWNTCQACGYELDKIKEAVNEFLEQNIKQEKTRS